MLIVGTALSMRSESRSARSANSILPFSSPGVDVPEEVVSGRLRREPEGDPTFESAREDSSSLSSGRRFGLESVVYVGKRGFERSSQAAGLKLWCRKRRARR